MHTEHTTKLNNEPALRTLPLNVESSPSTKLNNDPTTRKLNDEPALRALLSQIGFQVADVADLAGFMRHRAGLLYGSDQRFRAFLDKQTDYCSPETSGGDRWRHYLDGRTAQKSCPECGAPVKDYHYTYCSELCANRGRGAHRRTKNALKLLAEPEASGEVSLKQVQRFERNLAKHRPGYTLVTYGPSVSTIRHSCGLAFEATNRNMLYGQVNCDCLHRKGVGRSLVAAQRQFEERGSDWLPQSASRTKIKCVHRVCGHTQVLTMSDHAQPCDVCAVAPNPVYKTLTHDQHHQEMALRKPDFQLVGTWESPTAPLQYRHDICDKVFDAAPMYMQRQESECPLCSSVRQAPMPLSVVALKALVAAHLAGHPDWDSTHLMYGDAVPHIAYSVENRQQVYRPQFFLPDRNLLIEVCTPDDLGFALTLDAHGGPKLWAAHCAKVGACKRDGFKFLALLFVGERGTVMVDGWGGFGYHKALTYFQTRFSPAALV